jgi:hypothetical protein
VQPLTSYGSAQIGSLMNIDCRDREKNEKRLSPQPTSSTEPREKMRTVGVIITTKSGKSFDTDRDLTAPERHILQKLIIWQLFASSVDQFREKEKEAMFRGWNNSGPIKTSEAMRAIFAELEENVVLRLSKDMK